MLGAGLWSAQVTSWTCSVEYLTQNVRKETPDCFSIMQTWSFLYFCTLPIIGSTSWVWNSDISKTLGAFYFLLFATLMATILIFQSQPKPVSAAKRAHKWIVFWCVHSKHLHVTDETGVTGGVPSGKSGAFWWDTWSSLETPPLRRGGGRASPHRCPSVGLVAIEPQCCVQRQM